MFLYELCDCASPLINWMQVKRWNAFLARRWLFIEYWSSTFLFIECVLYSNLTIKVKCRHIMRVCNNAKTVNTMVYGNSKVFDVGVRASRFRSESSAVCNGSSSVVFCCTAGFWHRRCPQLPIWVQQSHYHLPNHVSFEFFSYLFGLSFILPSIISCKSPSCLKTYPIHRRFLCQIEYISPEFLVGLS